MQFHNIISKNIFIVILVTLNLYLLINKEIYNRSKQKEIISYVSKIEEDKSLFIQNLILYSQKIEINYDSIFNNHHIENPLLIYAYTGDECDKCILEEIYMLKNNLNGRNKSNVIILPVMENTRNINISLKTELQDLNYKRINKGLIQFAYANNVHNRFFAIVRPNGELMLPFFPNRNFPERTNEYLNYVFKNIL